MSWQSLFRVFVVFCAVLVSSVAQAQVHRALIIKELDPWGFAAVEDECTSQGIPFDVIGSNQVATTDFYDYNMIFVMSCQADVVYNAVSNNTALFDPWVRDGGFLALHGCNRSCGSATGNTFPNPPGGNPVDVQDFVSTGNVQNGQHPLMANLGGQVTGTSLAHTSFTSTGSMTDDVLITAVGTNNAVYFVRPWGVGHIAVGGLTSEYGYANSQSAGTVLRNEVTWGDTHQIDCGDVDTDGDLIMDDCDLCPTDPGNDEDYDGVCFADDLCEGYDDANDADYDSVPDGCDLCPGRDDSDDIDGDLVPDDCDNCPYSPNPQQVNEDNDAWGQVCDCDDNNFLMNRSETEVCDGLDNDCDGTVDGPSAVDVGHWYQDLDMDGEGNPDTEIIQCEAPDGYVDNALDCDDTTRAVRTSAPDACDGLDNDCDGIVDNNCVSDDTDDEDGKGAAGSSTSTTQGGCNTSGRFPTGLLVVLGALISVRRRRR